MKSPNVNTPAPPSRTAEKLAIHGGPKAVEKPQRDRWRSVRLLDTLPILNYVRIDKTTAVTGGECVRPFEQRYARLACSDYALAMNSGTATIHSALFAVGVGPGDEVILPTYTFNASAAAVRCCGANCVFCDIDLNTLNADPEDIERKITPRTKAILVVHIWGNPAKLDVIKRIAEKHSLPLIEDCSHAHGAEYLGKSVGAWGDIGCFSIQASKAVSGGECGIAVCSDPVLYDRMLALGHPFRIRVNQKAASFDLGNSVLGPKYRPHMFAIPLASGGLRRLPKLNRLRQRNWDILCEEMADTPGVRVPETLPDAVRGGFLKFVFVLEPELSCHRDEFLHAAVAEGVPLKPDLYSPLHKQNIFRQEGPLTAALLEAAKNDFGPPEHLPNMDIIEDRVIALPPLTKVPEKYLRECARGIKKVAHHFHAAGECA